MRKRLLKWFEIMTLLFAYDSVLISDRAEALQNSINAFEKYCIKWKLTVHVEKTKALVFQRGRNKQTEVNFTYCGCSIETVTKFNYLGIVFTEHYMTVYTNRLVSATLS